MSNPSQSAAGASQAAVKTNEIADILGIEEEKKSEAQQTVGRLIEDIVSRTGGLVPANLRPQLKDRIAELDRRISDQVTEILHDKSFQALEATWRGLREMVFGATLEARTLEVKVMNISKDELSQHFKDFPGAAWMQSPLYQKLYSEGLGINGGDPVGMIVGDYEFDHSADDVDTLRGMSKIAASCQAPFISSVAPTLFGGAKSWHEVTRIPELKAVLSSPAHNRWNQLRNDTDSRYLGLTAVRALGRSPYGEGNKVDKMDFVERTDGKPENYVWMNPAYLMARNVANAFSQYRWCAQIRGPNAGGKVEGLAQHVFQTREGLDEVVGTTEAAITNARSNELSDLGLLPLEQIKNSADAAFISAQSFNLPVTYKGGAAGEESTANAALSARLPYTFAACRVIHYLKCIIRDRVGQPIEEDEIKVELQNWLNDYVLPNPQNASVELKAQKPIREANIEVKPVPGNPGYYDIRVLLRPHFQLEGANVDVALATQVKQGGG
ncbi:MAG: type VI secretion system contractile sheath large subunit [Verrucomicrobiales bacterium]|nr:type VI secretion system contractile sheath large subunit [Verrucomicrobiales bacterium]